MTVELADGVLRLTFTRPEVLNALSGLMAVTVAEQLERATADDDVRVVVITGSGGSFSAGADISGADAHERFDVRALDAANRIIRAEVACSKPVLAAVDGVAAGVGCSIALAADVIVASESAAFLLAFSRIGLMPDGGTSATVAAAIGRARAMRMTLLAEPLTGQEAYDAGLVTHVAAAEEFAPLVEKLTRGWPPVPRWRTPPPRRRSTRPPSTSSRAPSSGSGRARPSCSAPRTSPRACGRSPSTASRTSAAADRPPKNCLTVRASSV